MTTLFESRAASSLLLLALAAIASHAQGITTQGPSTGVLFDERSGTLRPINGLPGSTLLGPALPLPFSARKAVVHAKGFALALSAGDTPGLHLIRNLLTGQIETDPIDVNAAAIDQMYVSADGATALLYSRSNATLQLVRGLPSTPAVSSPLPVTGLEALTHIALDSSSDIAIAITLSEDVRSLVRISLSDGAITPVSEIPQPAAVAFSLDGFFIVSTSGALYRMDRIGQPLRVREATNELNAVAVCAESSRQIAIISASAVALKSSGEIVTLPLDWKGDRCEALGSNRFLLNAPGKGPLQILDLSQAPQIFLTPADQAEVN